VGSSYGTDSDVEESDADGESSQGMIPRSVRCGFDVTPHQAGADDSGPQSINASTLVPGTIVEASDACQGIGGSNFLPEMIATSCANTVLGAQSGSSPLRMRRTKRLNELHDFENNNPPIRRRKGSETS
jgi:hypothetical protein